MLKTISVPDNDLAILKFDAYIAMRNKFPATMHSWVLNSKNRTGLSSILKVDQSCGYDVLRYIHDWGMKMPHASIFASKMAFIIKNANDDSIVADILSKRPASALSHANRIYDELATKNSPWGYFSD